MQNFLMFVFGLVVLVEGVNKLERTDVTVVGLTRRQRLVVVLKGAGWFCLVLGAGGAVFSGLLPIEYVRLGYAFTVVGFGLLVLRSRLRETEPGQPPIGSDEFERTQVLRVQPSSEAELRAALRTSMVIDRDVNRRAGERAVGNAEQR